MCVCMRVCVCVHTSTLCIYAEVNLSVLKHVRATDIQVWRFDTKHRLTNI